ncbi:MAG: GNAT family N-acetyltransferase [Micropruina sp.]|uniref:GNAT family N-acetyltransferase n=1 Tax=Micropruina sp. TaxID=2737536 RepID=UPI0039E5FEC6
MRRETAELHRFGGRPAPRADRAGDNLTTIRPATRADWPALDLIEVAADALFDGVLELPAAPAARSAELAARGFTLVAVDADDRPRGFVQVLELDARFHLEQLSVHPDAQRRGVGAALLAAAEDGVRARGGSVVTLRTFADVPWNAPFYRRHGYRDAELPMAMTALLDAEERLGLLRVGARVTLAKQVAEHVRPWPAVSVLPLRDAAAGLEVFVQYRASTMDFAEGAVVFPGGRVLPGEQAVPVPVGHTAAWAATELPEAGVLAAAAIREVAEECGVLLGADDLLPWDDWVTPPGGRRRFDVAFFLTAARPGQHWRNTTTEAVRTVWVSPAELLRDADAGGVRLLPPTRTLLTELAGLPNVAAAMAARPPIVPVLHDRGRPRLGSG